MEKTVFVVVCSGAKCLKQMKFEHVSRKCAVNLSRDLRIQRHA